MNVYAGSVLAVVCFIVAPAVAGIVSAPTRVWKRRESRWDE